MILDIDMGNTRVKWRSDWGSGASESWQAAMAGWQSVWPQVRRIRLSSVAGELSTQSFVAALTSAAQCAVEIAKVRQGLRGLQVAYQDCQQLGVDRWLAMLAGRRLTPGSDLVVVSAGTAITVDLLRANGQHMGGYIVPGFRAAIAALGSAAAPLAGYQMDYLHEWRPGVTTPQCLQAGHTLLYRGFFAESSAIVQAELQTPMWLFSGGDAEALTRHLPGDLPASRIGLYPGLVLDGLAEAMP